MKKARLIKLGDVQHVAFTCLGCDEEHHVPVEGSGWSFNGSLENPTLSPSVLVRSGHYASHFDGGDCWCNFEERRGKKTSFKCKRCHSFVRDGKIQYLNDCSHNLAGQTIDLPEIHD